MKKTEEIEKIVKDKVQENVDEIVKNALQDANLKDLIDNEINSQIKATDSFANLIRNLTHSHYLNSPVPIQTVQEVLTKVEKSKTDIQTLTNAYYNIIKNNNDTINNITIKNQDALTLLNKTTNEAEDIKNDLSAYRNQLVNGCLFRAFEVRAKIYDKKAQTQERWSIGYLWGLGVFSLFRIGYFLFVEYSREDFLLKGNFWISLLFSALFAILLSVLSYLSSNKYHMNKKLAEEYWHKASILKSFVGYKTQYQQNMEDAEYKVFFEYLVKAIMLNPADKINVFLNKKLPIEKILETPKNIVEGVKEVAKNVES